MKLDKTMANLIFEMEYIIGNECYNPNSYDGYTGEEGRSFRYPVYVHTDDKASDPCKYRRKIYDVQPEQIKTMKYKFGANHLFIGGGLINILDMLEKRYNINFNEMEKTLSVKHSKCMTLTYNNVYF